MYILCVCVCVCVCVLEEVTLYLEAVPKAVTRAWAQLYICL